MAPRTSTKTTKPAAEQAAAAKPQATPSGEQQAEPQTQQNATPPGDDGAATKGVAQDAQGDTPAAGETADYVEAVGFTVDVNGDVLGADGRPLPPVFSGDSGEAMVLQALALACMPAAATAEGAGARQEGDSWALDADEKVVQRPESNVPLLAFLTANSQAVADVLTERARQIKEKGYSAESDAQYQNGELAQAAACYALYASGRQAPRSVFAWPFQTEAFRPHDKRRALVKGAALMLAALDALDAAAEPLQP